MPNALNNFLWGQLLIVVLVSVGLVWMYGIGMRLLKDYDQQVASGLQPRLRVEDYADLDLDRRAWTDESSADSLR